jgi:hypothetical protein
MHVFRAAIMKPAARSPKCLGSICLVSALVLALASASLADEPKPEGKADPAAKKPEGKTPPNITELFKKYPVTDVAPLPLWKDDAPETELYCYILSLAQQTERSTFAGAARKDVKYEQAFNDPASLRGEVIHLEGILRRLKRIEAPEPAKARGVDYLYVGWVFDPKNPQLNRPWYVVFTRLPTKFDLKPRPDRRVTFDGYFFKRLRFEVEDSWFDAPLVIGRTPALVNELPTDVAYRQRGSVAAASLSGLGGPLQLAAPLATGVFNQTWPAIEEKPWDKLPEVGTRIDLSAFTIIDREPVLSYDQDRSMSSEAIAFSNVLVTAHKMPNEALKKGARKDATYAHFMNQSEKYRGELVHVKGTLARVRRFDPSRFSKPEGITAEYEGWIYDPKSYGANPMCIYFTDLPSGVEVGEKLNIPVAFDGYFFKRYRYQTGGKTKTGENAWRDAPLLIGRTVEVGAFDTTPVQQGITTNRDMITAFLGLLVVTMSLALGIAYFYRRGDRAIRTRIAGASSLSFAEAPPEDGMRPNPTGSDPTQFSGFPQSSN